MKDIKELRAWLALWHIPEIGPSTFYKLQKRYTNLQDIFLASTRELQNVGLSDSQCHAIHHPDWKAVKFDLQWATQPNHFIVTIQDNLYPPQLKEISTPPPILYVKGKINILQNPQIAIVGSRYPSPTGKETAWQFAKALAETGLTITSGLALGIDKASHEGCLAGNGQTIAVLGSGLNKIYPAQHTNLAQKILNQGVLISEHPPNTRPHAQHFPQRNRIISGLSLGVIVVEAAQKSGSLNTAKHAVEQGREVFAIPGSIHNPLSRGCHGLIRQGAKLVENINDVLEEFTHTLDLMALNSKKLEIKVNNPHLLKNKKEIIENIGDESTSIDILVERTGLTADAVSSMLLELELQGDVLSVPGGYIRRQHEGS